MSVQLVAHCMKLKSERHTSTSHGALCKGKIAYQNDSKCIDTKITNPKYMIMIMTHKLRIHVFIESKFMVSKKSYRIIDWLKVGVFKGRG